MAPLMRPANFRHERNGTQIVEITMEEYTRSKKEILRKIRRRIIALSALCGFLGLCSFIIAIIINVYMSTIVKFNRTSGNVRLRDLYIVHGAASVVFALNGFYVDGKWNKYQRDGNQLVMHVRLFSFLGFAAWCMALWLTIATLSIFGLVDLKYIPSSNTNIVYFITLILMTIHLLVAPWLLRTVHRKGSQADEYYGAEFMSEIRKGRKVKRSKDDDEEDDFDEIGIHLEVDEGKAYPIPRTVPNLLQLAAGDDDEDDAPRSAMPIGSARNRNGSIPMSASAPPAYSSRGGAVVSPVASTRSPPGSSRMRPPMASPAAVPIVSSRTMASPHYAAYSAAEAVHAPPAKEVSEAGDIPFASPVGFMIDPEREMKAPSFWQNWKQIETTGSFSCMFKNRPKVKEVEAHLKAQGFRIISAEVKENIMQIFFYGHQYGSDTFFLSEFVLIQSRSFFQATFKCKDRNIATEFVTRFNLQDLLVVEEE